MRKLVLVGSTVNPVHVRNYYNLIKDYFDDVLIIGTHKVDFCKCEVINFSLKNPFAVLNSIKKLRAILKEYNPTFVHIHQANSIGYITSLANKGKYPQIMTTWGDDVLTNPYRSQFHRRLAIVSLKNSDAITADAQSMADSIHRFYKEVPVSILNFGIDLFEIDQSKENIIYSNRLHNDLYNIDKIISGSIPFLEENKDWKLIIAAVGNNTDALKVQAKESGVSDQIEFVGFLSPEENRKNYFKAKVYVSIPETDGTAISLLESLAYGCLPIVSDIPSNNEWITNKVNGLIVPNFDINEGLQQVNQMDLDHVQQLNKEIIQKRATKEANRKGFIEIYERLLKQKSH